MSFYGLTEVWYDDYATMLRLSATEEAKAAQIELREDEQKARGQSHAFFGREVVVIPPSIRERPFQRPIWLVIEVVQQPMGKV